MFADFVPRFFVAFLVICIQQDAYESVKIEISPKALTIGASDDEVRISCSAEGLEPSAKGILYMTITRNGYKKPLAYLHQNSKISVSDSSTTKDYTVSGNIETNLEESYLALTLKDPKTNDTGTYLCSVYFLEEHGILQHESASGSLEVEKIDVAKLQALVNVLKHKLTNLIDHVQILSNHGKLSGGVDDDSIKAVVDEVKGIEDVLRKHNESVTAIQDGILELNNATNNHSQQIDTLASKDSVSILSQRVEFLEQTMVHHSKVVKKCCSKDGIKKVMARVADLDTRTQKQSEQMGQMCDKDDLTTVENKLTSLSSNVTHQSMQINNLDHKVGHPSAFSAALNSTHKLAVGEGIVFSDIIMSKGQGYNPDTGVFTAPIDGVYTFHLVAMVNCFDCHVNINLLANKKVLASLAAEPTKIFDQSSVSTVTELKKGDAVRVVLASMSDKAELHSNKLSLFSGYLIAAN